MFPLSFSACPAADPSLTPGNPSRGGRLDSSCHHFQRKATIPQTDLPSVAGGRAARSPLGKGAQSTLSCWGGHSGQLILLRSGQGWAGGGGGQGASAPHRVGTAAPNRLHLMAHDLLKLGGTPKIYVCQSHQKTRCHFHSSTPDGDCCVGCCHVLLDDLRERGLTPLTK